MTYRVDPDTLGIDATRPGAPSIPIMEPLHAPQAAVPSRVGGLWRWTDADGRVINVTVVHEALRLTIDGGPGMKLGWNLPVAGSGTWLIPDGEGLVIETRDPFWRAQFGKGDCLGATASLSFPAWSRTTDGKNAVVYALGDGLQSELCLHDRGGVQGRLVHDFGSGAGRLDLLFAIRPADPLAPALFYRAVLKRRGQFRSFADKAVPDLPRLFGAPQAYVWGDGRDLAFLDDLSALGIRRIVLSYDQDPRTQHHVVGRAYLARANTLSYLAGPYDEFDNGQPESTADTTTALWGDLYPAGCIRDRDGHVVAGFAGRGCEMSSEAIARHKGPPSPTSRFADHVAEGARQIFLDVDAFGDFEADFSPDHPMTMARDRANRIARMRMAIGRFELVLGSENVTAWSSLVTHYSHGTAQAHASAVWPLLRDKERFGGWWPTDRPALFFKPFAPTPDEARLLFGPADRLPLFEAAFHDSVVAADRWEFGLMKVAGEERSRFARALLYGTPTMWNLDRRELTRVAPWLKAAQDDFAIAHGIGRPVALTGFKWLTPDRLVQQATYADGRVLTANFRDGAWRKLGPDCVRVSRPKRTLDLCPPTLPGR
ncbi:MAG TPA: glycoside hydrolase [Allosphingosinicella sp.]